MSRLFSHEPLLVLIAATGMEAVGADAPKTLTVQPAPFRVEATVDGVFEPLDQEELLLDPEEWEKFVVEKALPAGSVVKEGDEILWLATKDFERAFRETELQLALSRLAIEVAQVELAALDKTLPLDVADAEQAKKQSDEDWDFFNEVGEKLERRMADISLQMSKQSMEGALEELNQLEKMYKADDLTEETEEIILKRARADAERSKAFFEQATIQHDRRLNIQMPRDRRSKEESVARANVTYEKQKIALPAQLQQKKLEMEKLRHTHHSLEEKLGKLRHDRELLTLKSPVAGTLYYGENEKGKWITTEVITKMLRKGSPVAVRQVLFTIVSGPRLAVRAEVPEKDLRNFARETVAVVKPTLAPDERLNAKVIRSNLTPVRDGIYGVELELEKPEAESLRGGMTCKVTVAVVDQKDAIAVPTSAVFSDEDRPDRKWVAVSTGEGMKPEKRDVETGPASASRTLIRSGLKAGETILLTKPE